MISQEALLDIQKLETEIERKANLMYCFRMVGNRL